MTVYEFKSPVNPEIGVVISDEAVETIVGQKADVLSPNGGMKGKVIDAWIEGDWIHYKIEVPGDIFYNQVPDLSINKD